MNAASPRSAADDAAEACRPAEAFLERWIGLDAQTIGSDAIARALRARMDACGESDEEAFLARLDRDAEERGRFIDEVVVPESWFFRDQQVFDFLRQLATTCARTSRPAPLRVLCVPCAAGEEPYSIAMVFLESGLSADQFRIDATDVSHAALKRAAAAAYSANAFRADDVAFRDRWFREQGRSAVLDEAVRQQVHFAWGNLLDESFATDRAPYDIIFCRNLLIYLTAAARNRAEKAFDRLLAPEGILVLGAAEPAILKGSWRPVASNAVFTLRRGDATVAPWPVAPPITSSRDAVSAPPAVRTEPVVSPAIDPAPATIDAVLREAGALANAGRHAEAIEMCLQHQRTAGPSAPVFFLMGMLHQAVGRIAEAEACLHKTLYLDATHDEAFLSLASLASQRGDAAMAERYRQSAARVLARKGAS